MSKLVLLISLMMSFIAIKANALSGEDQIKADCYKKTGSYGGSNPKSPYQLCLRANGILKVERNVSGSDDKSKADARICNASNPLCSKCIGLYGSGDAKSARTKITECVQREENKRASAAKPKPKEPTINGGRLQEVTVTARAPCSKTNPRNCTTMTACETNNGVWSDQAQACAATPCPTGTTPDPRDSKYCVCDSEMTPYSIERGSAQQCPAMCKSEDHKEYNIVVRGCICASGFEDRTGAGTCVSKVAAPASQVAACIQELQDKITACNTASTAAVEKCDPKRESREGDSLDALQGLFQGAAVAGGAAGNCGQAAIAGSTGYYAIEELRGGCDNEISACKTSCGDATAYINANKDRVYQKCRAKAWDDHQCLAPSATTYRSFTEDAFNVEWDGVNRAPFEQQIQAMQTSVTDYNSRCEAGGTADSNRDKMTGFMDDMNSAYKSAKQCECQLGSGANCDSQSGPAECAGNPSLPGCALVGVNCLSATDNSPKCVCFKNPNSDECKNIQQTNNNLKVNSTDVSAFAGVGSGVGGSASGGGDVAGKTDSGNVNVGDLSGVGADDEAIGANASGTTTVDAGSPFGAAAGGGSGAGGSSGGGANGATAAEADGEEESTGKKLGGLFNVAKSALGNLFKKGKDDKGTYDPVTGKYINENGLDSKKWRPRGMVRGLAGDTEIAGKFEDIWKVMNRQYKIQDQKDTFLFGGEKK